MCVYGRGEMMIEGRFRFPPDVGEHVEQEHLHVSEIVGVPGELRVEPTYICLVAGDLPREEVWLVEE